MRCSSAEWWKCFSDPEWLQALYVGQLRYARYGAVDVCDGRGGVVREAYARPGAHDVPSVVRSVLAYNERGERGGALEEPEPLRAYNFRAVNVTLPHALDLAGSIFAVDREGGAELVTQTHVDVRFLGWGDLLERRIEKELRRGFAIAADLASSWARGETFVLRKELA